MQFNRGLADHITGSPVTGNPDVDAALTNNQPVNTVNTKNVAARVTDVTGIGISNAVVTTSGGSTQRTTNAGIFSFKSVPVNQSIKIEAQGFSAITYPVTQVPRVIVLEHTNSNLPVNNPYPQPVNNPQPKPQPVENPIQFFEELVKPVKDVQVKDPGLVEDRTQIQVIEQPQEQTASIGGKVVKIGFAVGLGLWFLSRLNNDETGKKRSKAKPVKL